MSRQHTKAGRRRSFREHMARVRLDAWLYSPAADPVRSLLRVAEQIAALIRPPTDGGAA